MSQTELTKSEKKKLTQQWETAQATDYLLSEENVEDLFDYLETQLENTPCDHTLCHTRQWLADNLPAEIIERVIAEINEMGGYCDCEVLMNCYEDYDIG